MKLHKDRVIQTPGRGTYFREDVSEYESGMCVHDI